MSKREREVGEVAGAARRMIRALGRRVADADPIDLQLILDLQDELDAAYDVAVAGQRVNGFSYAEIGAGVGKSKQAVAQRIRAGGDRSVAS